jgi:uncharacterized membrane protein
MVLALAIFLVTGISTASVTLSRAGSSDIHKQTAIHTSSSENVPDAQVEVSIENGTVEPGATTTVTVEITNDGADATGGSVELSSPNQSVEIASTNPVFLGFAGNEAPKSGESITQTFTVEVNESAAPGTYNLSADVELSNTAGDDNVDINTSLDVQEQVRPAPALTTDIPQQVSPGTTFTAEYNITNRASDQVGGGSIELVGVPPQFSINGQSTQFIGVGSSPPSPGEQITKSFELTVNESASAGQDVSLVANASLQYSDGSKATNETTSTVSIVSSSPTDRFDTNGQPGIQRDEVVDAIIAFQTGSASGEISREDVIKVIVAYNS